MKRYYFLYLFLPAVLYGCDSFVELDMPPNQMSAQEVFNDANAATAAISGMYAELAEGQLSANMQIAMALSADELDMRLNDEERNQFLNNDIQINNSQLSAYWSELYALIYQANVAIASLETATLDDPLRLQLLGEARFIRAFCYFYLVSLWGDVPLITQTAYEANQSIPRTTRETVYEQLIADLTEAKTLLNSDYPTAERVRPNAYTAGALLARVYLYVGDWANAEREATEVISSGDYGLPGVDHVFLKSSEGVIWQLMSRYNYTNIGQQLVPWSSSGSPNYPVADALQQAIPDHDSRRQWMNDTESNGERLYYPFKYRLSLSSQSNEEYLVVFRLAEQYLIRAEARARLNRLDGPDGALADLQAVRLRTGLGELNVAGQAEVLAAIERERQVELAFEWGHRWLDLKRTQRMDEVLAPYKGDQWQPADSLWPIPLSQLQTNPFLEQNDGYPKQ